MRNQTGSFLRHLILRFRRYKPPTELTVSAQATLTPEEIAEAKTFTPTDYGSGDFGQWILDDAELPAYNYTIDQFTNPDAEYPTSRGTSVSHWHQIGNERITGIAYNDGTVKAFIEDRSSTFLNEYGADEPRGCLGVIWEVIAIILFAPIRWLQIMLMPANARPRFNPNIFQRIWAAISPRGLGEMRSQLHAYVGGYSYLSDGDEVWNTAYRYQSDAVRQNNQRVFGMGYFKTVTEHRDLRVTRYVYAPKGDVSTLLVDVEIENIGNSAKDFSHYEYWDVNIEQLTVQLIRAGIAGRVGDVDRENINLAFETGLRWDEDGKAMRFSQTSKQQPPPSTREQIDEVNWYPDDVYLASLSEQTIYQYTNKDAFFGKGGAENPDGIVNQTSSNMEGAQNAVMPYCMVMRQDLNLGAGESTKLRFAYGTVNPEESLAYLDEYREGEPRTEMLDDWKARIAYFKTGDSPFLQREMAWQSYYLMSSVVYSAYFKTHLTPQGSAYLFLQGSDGAPRDQSLFAIPLAYINPELARANLRLIMRLSDGVDGKIPYAFTGFGVVGGAGIHDLVSDLDIFFLWALTEYIVATGDFDFLYEKVEFNPASKTQPADATVLTHIEYNFKHLIDKVGFGPDNLIRILEGDWSDSVVLSSLGTIPPGISPVNTVKEGESIPNSQMALYVLPRLLNMVASQDTPEAQHVADSIRTELTSMVPQLQEALKKQWVTKSIRVEGQLREYGWYVRMIARSLFFNRPVQIHKNQIDLESQVWALINEDEHSDVLIKSVYDLLDKFSPVGAPSLQHQLIWAAIVQLLTWGYTRKRPDLAWRSLVNNSFATHATVFPKIWFNVWSGPDALYSPHSTINPGGTWSSFVTPMTDFPLMNNNQPGMALLAMLRVCGIEPTLSGDGLLITPQVPDTYALDLPLIKVDATPKSVSGEYRPIVNGERVLYIHTPDDAQNIQASINGASVPVTISDGYVSLGLQLIQGQAMSFNVNWE